MQIANGRRAKAIASYEQIDNAIDEMNLYRRRCLDNAIDEVNLHRRRCPLRTAMQPSFNSSFNVSLNTISNCFFLPVYVLRRSLLEVLAKPVETGGQCSLLGNGNKQLQEVPS